MRTDADDFDDAYFDLKDKVQVAGDNAKPLMVAIAHFLRCNFCTHGANQIDELMRDFFTD